jgi:HAD superfamily hydrolase (TIGR01509 family)
VRALVFDFDGLILDTEVPAYATWQEVYQRHGHELALELWASVVGHGPGSAPFDPHRHLEGLTGQSIDAEAVRRWRRPRTDALIEAEAVRPGVETYVAEARRRGLRLAVASSSPLGWVEGHLRRLGLRDAFEHLSCAGGELRGKPWPDVYLGALSALGVAGGEAIALEDSPTGVAAAREAGIFVVAVPNRITASLDFALAHLRVESLAEVELAELIRLAELGFGPG